MLHYYNQENINEDNAFLKLSNKYKPTKANKLYEFYKNTISENPSDRQRMKSSYSRAQYYRNRRDIKLAGVGIEIGNLEIKNLKLNFPIKPCKSNKSSNT